LYVNLGTASFCDFCDLCSISNFEEIIGPRRMIRYVERAERAQFIYMKPSACRCPKPNALFTTIKARPCPIFEVFLQNVKNANGKWSENDIIRRMIKPHVKILSIHNIGKHYITPVLSAAPNLLALSCSLHWRFNPISDLDQAFYRVTHLSLANINEDTLNSLPTTLILPNIHYLKLEFTMPRTVSQSIRRSSPFKDWFFPHVESLIITGTADCDMYDDICALMKRCGKTVMEAIIEPFFKKREAASERHFIHNVWELLPNLRVYGAGFFALGSTLQFADRCSPQENGIEEPPPLTLLINHVWTHVDCRDTVTRLAGHLRPWNVNKIVIADTWRQLHGRLINDGDTREKQVAILCNAWYLFNDHLQTGIPILDRLGTVIKGDEARFFWDEMHQAHLAVEKTHELEANPLPSTDASATLPTVDLNSPIKPE
jgi:hypothetical protein